MSDTTGLPGSAWATLLRTTRAAKGWTQDDLAEEAGVHRTTVIRQEKGEVAPDRATRDKLADALDIPRAAAAAAVEGVLDEIPLPPPLPVEIARLVAIYQDMKPDDRRKLLERVQWVNEWGAAVVGDQRRGGRNRPA